MVTMLELARQIPIKLLDFGVDVKLWITGVYLVALELKLFVPLLMAKHYDVLRLVLILV
jgi:hypothetical protein